MSAHIFHHGSGVRDLPQNRLEQGGFSCTIRADQGNDLTAVHMEIDI